MKRSAAQAALALPAGTQSFDPYGLKHEKGGAIPRAAFSFPSKGNSTADSYLTAER
jgi:hypothetical protein